MKTTIKTLYQKGYNKTQIGRMLGIDRKLSDEGKGANHFHKAPGSAKEDRIKSNRRYRYSRFEKRKGKGRLMDKKSLFTVNELLEVADQLRGMLDDEIAKNNLLHQRNEELELLLEQNGITIPDFELWHGELPMA